MTHPVLSLRQCWMNRWPQHSLNQRSIKVSQVKIALQINLLKNVYEDAIRMSLVAPNSQIQQSKRAIEDMMTTKLDS